MRRIALHGALALVGLSLAYAASRPTPEASHESGAVVFDCAEGQMGRITFEAEHRRLVVAPAEGGGYVVEEHHEPDHGEATTEHYRSGAAAEQLFAAFAPLRAGRDLGVVPEDQLADLGLGDDAATLSLSCGSRHESLRVGESAYGSGQRYLRAEDGHVFLVDDAPLRSLRTGRGRLMQRELVDFERTDIVRVDVSAFGRTRSFEQRNRVDPRNATWVDAAQPDRPDELVGNWLASAERLRAQDYLEGEPPAEAHEVVALRYFGEDGTELGQVELRLAAGDPERYFARSTLSHDWVEVAASLGVAVARDVAEVVGEAGRSEPPTDDPGASASPGG